MNDRMINIENKSFTDVSPESFEIGATQGYNSRHLFPNTQFFVNFGQCNSKMIGKIEYLFIFKCYLRLNFFKMLLEVKGFQS